MSATSEATDIFTDPAREERLLGVYLHDAEALILSDLTPDAFTGPRVTAFGAMRHLADNGQVATPVAVAAEAKKRGGRFGNELDTTYFDTLKMQVSFLDVGEVEKYEALVRDGAKRREALNTFHRAAKRLRDESNDVAHVLDRIQENLSSLSNGSDATLGGGATIADEGIGLVEQIFQARGEPLGLRTGLTSFDRIIGGLQPAQLLVLSAATGGGKSTLALQIAGEVAGNGHPVYYVALEDPANMCALRLAAGRASVDLQRFREQPSERDRQKLTNELERLRQTPLFIDDRTGATLSQLRARARQIHQQTDGLGLMVIDYLQLMASENRQRETRAVEVGSFANGLKALALELKIPVIALAQINRAGQNGGKRPDLSDLRESGDIENAANVVAFLYQPGRYDPTVTDPNLTELLIKKNRYGPQSTVYLQANLSLSRFNEQAGAV